MPRFRSALALVLALPLAGGAAEAWAQALLGPPVRDVAPPVERTLPEPRREEGHRRDDARGLSDAVRRAERVTRGQVLSAERIQYDGRDVNRVKVLDGRGRVRVMYWDDETREPPRPPRTRDDDGDAPTL